ncbi:MAG: chemotaxis protein CheW [Leptothrix sp. (in: b-proteobacteria)]
MKPDASPDSAAALSERAQYLTFLLDGIVFAVGIESVREIIQYGQMTRVPLMPAFVRGVINLRGAVVPVIDLQARLGRPVSRVGEKTCIVIFDAACADERIELGLMVEAVSEVIEIGREQIEPPPQFGSAVRREFIRGMARVKDRFVILLEPDTALDIEVMATLCEHEQERLAA